MLAVSPDNFEALKGAALGLAHLAQEEEHRVLHQLVATANGMVSNNASYNAFINTPSHACGTN